ncbi:MAG: hypothetical protein K5765_00640 [Clostridia bacterium]|nr:hypothetical protein [Clostridia bacterium]
MFIYKIGDKDRALFEKALFILNELNAPITDEAVVVYCHGFSRFGVCYDDMKYKFKIAINEQIIDDEKFINTAIHELLHTIDNNGYTCHRGNWKNWADIVSSKTKYKITVSDNYSKIKYIPKICNHEFVECICPICETKINGSTKHINSNGQSDYFCKKCYKPFFSFFPDSPIKDLSTEEIKNYIKEMINKNPSLEDILKCLNYTDSNDTRVLIRYCLTYLKYESGCHPNIHGYIDKKLKEELAIEYCNGEWDKHINSDKERVEFESIFSLTKWYVPVVNHGDKVFGRLGYFKKQI